MPAADHHFASPEALADALAAHVAQRLQHAMALRGHAVLAVSGGKSPVALFQRLRQQPLDWANVAIVLVDERCVPHQPVPHADSNTALVQQHLLQDRAAAAQWVPLFDHLPDTPLDPSTETGRQALDALASTASDRVAALGPITLAVLGMGEDGHTASLFPDAPGLNRALTDAGPVAWVCPRTAPHARLTLTLSALTQALECALALAGPAKQAVYAQAVQRASAELPVSLVLHRAHCSVWRA